VFEGVIAMDNEEKVALANPAAGRLLSFDPAEAAGCPLLGVVRELQDFCFLQPTSQNT